MSDEAVTVLLVQMFERKVQEVQKNPLTIVTANARRLKRGTSKAVPKTPQRRSYDDKPTPTRKVDTAKPTPTRKVSTMVSRSLSDTTDGSVALAQSASAPALATTSEGNEEEEKTDSWDSVKAQPACMICGMVFPTTSKLDTHVKYSSLHASNLKKMEEQQKAEAEKAAAAEAGASSEPEVVQQEPTSRCRVLYTGNKFFWRTKDNIDIHIYLHLKQRCLEVVAYEGIANAELPRLYLDETKLFSLIGDSTVRQKVAERKEKEKSKKFREKLPPDNILFEDEKRLAISSHIMSKLQLSNDTSRTTIYSKYLTYAGDAEGVLLSAMPKDVIPVHIPRRRHSSEEEFNESLKSLQSMQDDLKGLTEQAEKMANLMTQSVGGFSNATKKKKRLESFSVPRRRWLIAIDRVLLQNQVAKITKLLESYGDKYL
eukprot:CAMPEP_0185019210 /NCGR_PEP_ID=MMETSP1103-20130426/1848_1 /TAXON_ID=36769 /ORGANISM="Paraphysomonas bandaiensis, Strain Caron Lab Isolate" /LENGTH=427 /DNA_ID=CAMNT_0027549409 /DNA_START=231 /DNA_END=1514 /DNA_ORIENTATION=+